MLQEIKGNLENQNQNILLFILCVAATRVDKEIRTEDVVFDVATNIEGREK